MSTFHACETLEPDVETPQAWWRDPEPAVVALRLMDEGDRRTLVSCIRRVRPLARDLAGAISRNDGPGLVGEAMQRRGAGDCVATDLLASALLAQGAHGDPAARMLVDHMRRQRRLRPVAWAGRGENSAQQRLRVEQTIAESPQP